MEIFEGKMKSKLTDEQGRLTDVGKESFRVLFLEQVHDILNCAETEEEARILGANLSSFVADLISKKVLEFHVARAKVSKLWKMSDDEFEAYLTEKYKDVVAERVNEGKTPFFSMNEKEVERYNSIAKRKMRELRDEMDKEKLARQNEPTYGVRLTKHKE